MSSIFGGSKSKSENLAYGDIKNSFSPLYKYAGEGASGLSTLLGGDATGFNKYKDAVGYDWEKQRGLDDITSKYAKIGGLDSGATLKSIARFQSGLDNQYSQNYMQNLLGLSGIGTNAGSLVTQAGQKSTSSSTGGLAAFVGKAASAAASGGV